MSAIMVSNSANVFSQNDGSNCAKKIILPPAAELCNSKNYKIDNSEMWFEFTANSTDAELKIEPSVNLPQAEITKLQLFENDCPDLVLKKEIISQPPDLPVMQMEQLIEGKKYILKAEREPKLEEGNFKMCLTRLSVGGGGGNGSGNSTNPCKGVAGWKTFNADIYKCPKNGGVGIGVTSPLYKLHIKGGKLPNDNSSEICIETSLGFKWILQSHSKGFEIYDQTNTTRFYIKNDGNLGIGTSNPKSKLLQKVEELTLYIIKQDERMDNLEKKYEEQGKIIESLREEIKKIKN